MTDKLKSHEADVARLLQHHKGTEMDETFRLTLLDQTRRVVTAGGANHSRRWLFGLATGVAAVIIAVVLWQVFASAPRQVPGPGSHSNSVAAAGGPDRDQHADAKPTPTDQPALRPEPRQALAKRSAPTNAPEQPSRLVAPEKAQALFAVIAARNAIHQGRVAQGDSRAAALQGELSMGDRLPAGTAVATGKAGRLSIVTREGSEFTLAADSRLAIAKDGKSATLQQGRLYCRNRNHEFAAISTAAGRIQLLGTIVDAAMKDKKTVAVTVVEGKVRLENRYGQSVVASGRRAILKASAAPGDGEVVNTTAETAWYDGRGSVVSDFGQIAYTIRRGALATEVWVMNADGTGKQRIKTYVGFGSPPAGWLPGEQVLSFNTHTAIWTQPDFTARRAESGAGHPIIDSQNWLINAATGEDSIFALPAGYDPLYSTLSPDTTRLAFSGSYRPKGTEPSTWMGGVWVYDLNTGGIKQMLAGWVKTPVSWSPDGRYLAASTGEGYGNNYPLVIIEVATATVTPLNVQGVGTNFSPDGTRLAYCGDFKQSGSWYGGVPASGSIFVMDLSQPGQALRLSPEGEGSLRPHWSPDGTRVAYVTYQSDDDWKNRKFRSGCRVFVAQADGSDVKEVFRQEPVEDFRLSGEAWNRTGDGLYLTTSDGILLVAANGSGVIANLGGTEADSMLTSSQQQQTDAALATIREAIFQYAVGMVRQYEGKPVESNAAFQQSAALFAGVPFDNPLANVSVDNILTYAEKAESLAGRPAETILALSCTERQKHCLSTLLTSYAGKEGKFPADLAALETWSLANGWGIDWFSNTDTEWVKMIFRCPGTGGESALFIYTAPAEGADPKIGDVLVACPNHPEHTLVWDQQMADTLKRRREIEARRTEAK